MAMKAQQRTRCTPAELPKSLTNLSRAHRLALTTSPFAVEEKLLVCSEATHVKCPVWFIATHRPCDSLAVTVHVLYLRRRKFRIKSCCISLRLRRPDFGELFKLFKNRKISVELRSLNTAVEGTIS